MKPEDGRQFICSAANKGGASHQNFSLAVRQVSDDSEEADEVDEHRLKMTLYFAVLAVALVIGLTLLVVSLIRAKSCSRIRTTKLSPNLNGHPIDILQNVKTSDLEMKSILMTNKPEIALISDIIRDTNDLRPYRFGGGDPITPDVTRYGPHYSQQQSSASTTLSSSVSFDTFRSTPPLVVLDSTSRQTNNVTLHQFSADNRFQYKKFESNTVSLMNGKSVPNDCHNMLVFGARTPVSLLDMPSTTTSAQPYTIGQEPQLLKPVLTHSVSHCLELDKELIGSDLNGQQQNRQQQNLLATCTNIGTGAGASAGNGLANAQNNNPSISVTQV